MADMSTPLKGVAFTLGFTLYKNDGTVVANPGTYTKKILIDGANLADIAASVTEEDTTYGLLSIVLSTSEMNGDRISVYITDNTAGTVPFTCVLYPAAYNPGAEAALVHAHVATIEAAVDTEVATLVTEVGKIPKSDGTATWNDTAKATLQAECNDALVANNLDHLALTATSGTDMTTEVADGTILSRILSATSDTSTYLPSTDALEAIRDRGDLAWLTGSGASSDLFYVPSGAPTITTKHADAPGGAYTDLAVVDGNYWSVREAATTNPPLDFYFPFTAAAGVFPGTLEIWGYYSGNATHWMRVQAAVGGVTTVWEDIGTMPNASSVTRYSFALTPQHINAATGACYIRFLHNGVAGIASHYLYLDKLLFTAKTAPSALTDASIADAVWDELATGHTTVGKAGEQLWSDLDAVLADTGELQTNQGNWATATGFGTAAELAKVPKSDSTVSWNSTALAAINAEVDTALNTAIPGSPTTDSINERVKTLDDHVTADYGSTEKAAIDLLDDAAGGLADIHTDLGTVASDLTAVHTHVGTIDGHITADYGTTEKACIDLLDDAVGGLADIHTDVGTAITQTTAGAIATAVWGALCSGYNTVLTFGKYLGGAPANATLAADVAAVKGETAGIETHVHAIDAAVIDHAAGTDVAADIIALKTVADTIATDTTTDIPATITTMQGNVTSILADTGELQTDWANGGRLDLLLDTAASGGDAASIADAVWDETITSGHTGAGKAATVVNDILTDTGTTLDTKVNTIDTVVDGIAAALVSSPVSVSIASPLAASGTLTLEAGDDYSATESRSVAFLVADSGHALGLDGGTVVVKLKATQATFTASSVASTTPGYTVTFTLTHAQTAVLSMARQTYELEATLANGHIVTLARGTLVTNDDVPVVT